MVKAVFFDVGETLVDETRHWGLWADYMQVPRLTFFAALGAVIQRGLHHREVFKLFEPEFDVDRAWHERQLRGETYSFLPADFYKDALPCLSTLKEAGYVVGIAGNQPEGCEAALRSAGISADILASSHAWGIEKPSSAFFERIVVEARLPAGSIAYVGDRYDNDITPAHRSGLVPVHIRRGPWAYISDQHEASCARATIKTLAELPAILSAWV